MKTLKTIITATLSLGFASFLHAGLNETAVLNASISAGGLEIVPSSVTGPHNNVEGSVAITGSLQTDALTFNINGITINDLNGDGTGWVLSASPAANLVSGANNLPLGTTGGFNNPSDLGNTQVDSVNQITYLSGSGVVGYTVDYDVAYNIPALVSAGSYTGSVAFVLAAN